MSNLIIEKLCAINSEIGAISKGRKNQQQGFMFRGIDDVMNELHSLFAKHSVIILPRYELIEQQALATKSGGFMYRSKIKAVIKFVTIDGSSVESETIGEAMDSADKGLNKAESIALKYALLQMFLIPTEEDKDPDATTPEATYAATKQAPKQTQAPAPARSRKKSNELTAADIEIVKSVTHFFNTALTMERFNELKSSYLNDINAYQDVYDAAATASMRIKELTNNTSK